MEPEHIKKTKIEELTQRTGTIIRFIDYELPTLKTDNEKAVARVRGVRIDGEVTYFYQIQKTDKTLPVIGSIDYNDLVELINAMDTLLSSSIADSKYNPLYLENKYITPDGLQIGYYMEDQRMLWFVQLNRLLPETILLSYDYTTFFDSIKKGKELIEKLKGAQIAT